jgi:hypothetical protein
MCAPRTLGELGSIIRPVGGLKRLEHGPKRPQMFAKAQQLIEDSAVERLGESAVSPKVRHTHF